MPKLMGVGGRETSFLGAGIQQHIDEITSVGKQAANGGGDDWASADSRIDQGHKKEGLKHPGSFLIGFLENERVRGCFAGNLFIQGREVGALGHDTKSIHIHRHGRARVRFHGLVDLFNQFFVIGHPRITLT